LPLTVRKLLLIVGQSVVPPFPLLMDLLSTPLRTDCTRTCERETLIRPLTQPFRLASWQVDRGGAVLYREWIPRVRGNKILMVNGNEKQRFSR
jgi:hypothetical protein